ncbi:MAG: TetR/AcrR family transcriptional regulator [Methanospirillum sp.]|nr:TetR/AcrR family transcriptional regulator [Methanospirillum sp.]
MPKLFPTYRDEIRKKIITEAFAVFLEKGFEKTTLDEIAARLEVTKPALYRYFKNKDDLFMASIVEIGVAEYEHFQEILFTGDDIMANAGTYFDAVLAFSWKYQILTLDIFKMMRRNRSFRDLHPDYHEKFILMMQTGFEGQIQKGIIHPDFDSRTLAILCSSLIGGLVHFSIEETNIVEAKEIWLKGYAKLAGVESG